MHWTPWIGIVTNSRIFFCSRSHSCRNRPHIWRRFFDEIKCQLASDSKSIQQTHVVSYDRLPSVYGAVEVCAVAGTSDVEKLKLWSTKSQVPMSNAKFTASDYFADSKRQRQRFRQILRSVKLRLLVDLLLHQWIRISSSHYEYSSG